MFLKIFGFAFILMASVSTFSQISYPVDKGVPQSLAKWRAEHYSDVRYKLNLTIEKKAPTLKGTIEISLKSKTPRIILDWRKIRGHEKLSKVSNVSINGTKLRWNPRQPGAPNSKHPLYEIHQEHIYINDGAKIGENVIKLDFESPILTSGSAITRYIDKEDGSEYIYSLFVPADASSAFPVFDQPDLKARFKLRVKLEKKIENWQIVSNSQKIESFWGKSGSLTEFEETKPISTYVFAFAIGDFTSIFEKPVRVLESHTFHPDGATSRFNKRTGDTRIFVRKSQAKKLLNSRSADIPVRSFARQPKSVSQSVAVKNNNNFAQGAADRDVRAPVEEIFRLNRESIKFFEEYFDYKFPFTKYDLVLIPEFPFGGMEHAGATFLRESSIIFPTEPTANNYISRASLLFHENAHQWFGDTVTMKWFDDLWLKEGFATFMAYKAMEKIMPEYNAWKVFYERTKAGAYRTDVTKGTTPIYQEIPNLNSAKSAYGNIVYNKAPSFLRQAEFYLGEKEFQQAVRAFLKDHEFKNAEWSDLVAAFEKSSGQNLKGWADVWVKKRGLPVIRIGKGHLRSYAKLGQPHDSAVIYSLEQEDALGGGNSWLMKTKVFIKNPNGTNEIKDVYLRKKQKRPTKFGFARYWTYIHRNPRFSAKLPVLVFPNYGDHAYGIFLLDARSKKYALENIQNEKDDFLRSMMWGALWDSVRFAEFAPKKYIELAIEKIGIEKDVTTISSILGRVGTAKTYYLSESQQKDIAPKLEALLIEKIKSSKTTGERITYYRSFLRIASTDRSRFTLKNLLGAEQKSKRNSLDPVNKVRKTKHEVLKMYKGRAGSSPYMGDSIAGLIPLRTRDKFDIVRKLIILGDKDAPKLLAELEKTETSDAAKRYAYAAKAGFTTSANKGKYWNDFVNNKEISENWISSAVGVWNSPNHSSLTLPYLEKALAELPNHKQNRKIFFVNGWVASFIGGQKSEEALAKVNKFLSDNPKLDADLKRKILERVDGLERAVKIRKKYSN